jgi:voltage-gated potassium channel
MASRVKKLSVSPYLRKVIVMLPFFFGTFLFGTFGLHFIEGKTLFDSFFLTLSTVSTVGYGDGMSTRGRLIIIIVIFCSMTIVAYTVGAVLHLIIEGEISKTLGRRKLEKTLMSLKNHYILCGYGRIGKLIAKELKESGIQFVVIDNSPEAVEQMEKERYLFLDEDATSEETLSQAGIMKAKGLITAVKSDSDNVFITLTARSLNPSLFILARGTDPKDELKLKRAGATKVVLPYIIGGRRMAQAVIRPAVTDFIDVAMMDSDLGIAMEELCLTKKGFATGKNLIESNIRRTYGIIIVAIRKVNGNMIFNPAPQEVLVEGDVLVVLGKRDDLVTLKKSI